MFVLFHTAFGTKSKCSIVVPLRTAHSLSLQPFSWLLSPTFYKFLKTTKLLPTPRPSHLLFALPLFQPGGLIIIDTCSERSSLTFSPEVHTSGHPSMVISTTATQSLPCTAPTTIYTHFPCIHLLAYCLCPFQDHKLVGTTSNKFMAVGKGLAHTRCLISM